MISKTKKTKIESLQALRGIAFLGIFLSHALGPIEWPAISVSAFFVLSGFLLTCGYYNREDLSWDFKSNLKFAWKRIKPLYPLHLCMLVVSLALQIFPDAWENLYRQWGSLALNATLLQSWVPSKSINISFNGVSWFLSTILFFYFIFPCFIRLIRKFSFSKHIIFFIGLLTVQVFGCYLLLLNNTDSNIYGWFMYHFPLFRLADFYMGCILGKGFLSIQGKEKPQNVYLFTGMEIGALLLTIVLYAWVRQVHTSVFLKALCNETTLYILPAGIWVILFAFKKGVITKLLSNRVFVLLGNLSGYAFLIHLMVIQYFDAFCYYTHISPREEHNMLVVLLCYGITITISYVIYRIHRKRACKKE